VCESQSGLWAPCVGYLHNEIEARDSTKRNQQNDSIVGAECFAFGSGVTVQSRPYTGGHGKRTERPGGCWLAAFPNGSLRRGRGPATTTAAVLSRPGRTPLNWSHPGGRGHWVCHVALVGTTRAPVVTAGEQRRLRRFTVPVRRER
jgi:hypothetical protein